MTEFNDWIYRITGKASEDSDSNNRNYKSQINQQNEKKQEKTSFSTTPNTIWFNRKWYDIVLRLRELWLEKLLNFWVRPHNPSPHLFPSPFYWSVYFLPLLYKWQPLKSHFTDFSISIESARLCIASFFFIDYRFFYQKWNCVVYIETE